MRAPALFRNSAEGAAGLPSVIWRRTCTCARLLGLAVLYLLLGIVKHFLPLQRIARWMWRAPDPRFGPDRARRTIAAIIKVSRIVRADRDCVQRSLLMYRVLSRSGADPVLVVGFRRSESRVLGHAWILVAGRPVIEPEGEQLGYSPAFAFGPRGELQTTTPPDSICRSGCG